MAVGTYISIITLDVNGLNAPTKLYSKCKRGLYMQEIQEKDKDLWKQPKTIKKMATGTGISIITLNVNVLNAPTKRHRLAQWIQKQDPFIRCLQDTHFRPKDTYALKVRELKNKFHANGKQKKAGVAILILDKTDLKINLIN